MEYIQRKVKKIGNSIGLTLPPELIKQVELAQGEDIDAEFTEILIDVIKEHDNAFKGLVDR